MVACWSPQTNPGRSALPHRFHTSAFEAVDEDEVKLFNAIEKLIVITL